MRKQFLPKKCIAYLLSGLMLLSSVQLPGGTVFAAEENVATEEIHGLGYIPVEEEETFGQQGVELYASDEDAISLLGLDPDEEEVPLVGAAASYPAKYDPRETVGALPAIRDQGVYGTCWAFAAVACMEINLIKKNLADASIDLSELQLVYASGYSETDPLGNAEDTYKFINYQRNGKYITCLDSGGNYLLSTGVLTSGRGLTSEEVLPYTKAETLRNAMIANTSIQNISGYSTYSSYKNNVAKLNGFSYLDIITTDGIKGYITKYGCAQASYYAGTYGGDPTYYNPSTCGYYCNVVKSSNHAVVIVGWDDNYSKENFKEGIRPNNDGAWIVRNSWGTTYGEEGYFYLSYEDKSIVEVVGFDAVLNPAQENIYQYDGIAKLLKVNKASAYANRFVTRGNEGGTERITSAAFQVKTPIETSTFDYTVKVYTNVSEGKDPTTGTLAAQISGKGCGSGFYTVHFSSPIAIAEGDAYSVVLEMDKSIYMCVEDYANYLDRQVVSAAEAGQSFYYDVDGWNDAMVDSNIPNFCIKAYTENVGGSSKPIVTSKPTPTSTATTAPAPTPTSTATTAPAPTSTATTAPAPTPTSTATTAPAPAPTSTATTAPAPAPTSTATTKPAPTPTSTATAKPTTTVAPTLAPTSTVAPEPTSTATTAPDPTTTAPRRTDSPQITKTPEPTPERTTEPTPTKTTEPEPTEEPTPTKTTEPEPTEDPGPTATVEPTPTTEPTVTPTAKNGWLKEDGQWHYYTNNVTATYWKKLDGKWYYFNSEGAMQIGWKKFGSKWYYFNTDGDMVSGWKKIGTKWYYFNAGGDMVSGWKKIGTKWYYFNAGGEMVNGWKKVGGKWYYFNSGGDMAIGWKKVGSKWYYFNSDGDMTSGWKKISGKWYYFNAGGDMASGWKKLGGKWYYFTSNGTMVANTTKNIGGKTYSFDKNGVMR